MKSGYRFETNGTDDYRVYYNGVDIGTVVKISDKQWVAYTPDARSVGVHRIRIEAARALLEKFQFK
jgi:hypothetical protein